MKKKNIFYILILIISIAVLCITGCANNVKLNDCDQKRRDIEKKYGITIYYGNDEIKEKKNVDFKMCSDVKKIDTILDGIDDFFSKLPEGFVEEFTSYDSGNANRICIVIANTDYLSVSFDTEGAECWVINEEDTSMDLANDLMHSVLYHVTNTEDRNGFFDYWAFFNPRDFEYGNGKAYEKYLYGNCSNEECYFLIEETMESFYVETEILFSLLWNEEYIEVFQKSDLPKIEQKIKYICLEMKRMFEMVDENSYWNRQMKTMFPE